MAEQQKPGIEGNVAGQALSQDAKSKIQDVLKTTLHKELTTHKAAAGTLVGSRHGSVTHGSVIYEE